MSKSSLITQLRIDRTEAQKPKSGQGVPILPIAGGVLAALLLAALIWFLIARPDVMRVATAEARPVASGAATQGASLLDASGYVVARRQATVSAKLTGKVLQVMIEEGQHVAAGQVIARLDDSNARAAVAQAQAQAASTVASEKLAEVALTDAGPKYQRSKRIHEAGYLSDQAVEDARMGYDTALANLEVSKKQVIASRATLEVAQRALDDTVVRAPFAGVVTVKAAQPGEMVSPISAGGGFTRTGIGTIVDMDSLEVEVDVAESFINRVREGMPAVVKLNAYPEWEIPAEVIAVIPTADRSKATVTVRVGFKVKDPRIVPEMGARVSFLAPQVQGAAPSARSVIVPFDAVETEGGDEGTVYVVNDSKAERRAVRLGVRRPDGQELLAGVSAGEAVITSGQEKLKDGKHVRIRKAPAGE